MIHITNSITYHILKKKINNITTHRKYVIIHVKGSQVNQVPYNNSIILWTNITLNC